MPSFESPIAEFLYKLTPDYEYGSADGAFGWHGLYIGKLGTDEPEFTQLSSEDQEQLSSSEAAMLCESNNLVEVELFPSVSEAERVWEGIEDDWDEFSKK